MKSVIKNIETGMVGTITRLRESLADDEKLAIWDGIAIVVKKTTIDRIFEKLRGKERG